ncbi:MAG: 2-hydroxyacid dehydrogenase, partial [Deltaproteobacteria bacterium]
MNSRIVLFDTKPYDEFFFAQENARFKFPIRYLSERLSPKTADLAKGAPVACAFVNDILDARVLSILKKGGTGLIALRSAGYNNVDFKAAYRQRVHVVRVPAYSPYAVAEHALALMMTLNRKTHKAYFRTRDNNFSIQGLLGFDMHAKTCGVVGTGKIGRVMIRILKGLGMEVTAFDPRPDRAYARRQGFRYVGLDDLFKRSDIVTLHCPLTRETYHLINARTIARMKDGVMIVNTGRGKLIDTKALLQALKKGKVGAAGLDVYEEESEYFFEDLSNQVLSDDVLARLLTFPNVLITSHQGFFTREALTNIARTTLQNIDDFLRGRPLGNEI